MSFSGSLFSPSPLEPLFEDIEQQYTLFDQEVKIELQAFALDVPRDESRIAQAYDVLFPDPPERIIDYSIYQLLTGSDGSAAKYLASYYADAMRNVNGSLYFDLALIMNLVYKEFLHCKELYERFLGDINDQIRLQIASVLKVWTQTLDEYARTCRNFEPAQFQDSSFLSGSEASNVEQSSAWQFQAFSQAKINVANQQLAPLIHELEQYIDTLGDIWFLPFMQKPLAHLAELSKRKTDLIIDPVLGASSDSLIWETDQSAAILIADFARRNNYIRNCMTKLFRRIATREKYKQDIHGFSEFGRLIQTQFKETTLTSEDLSYYQDQLGLRYPSTENLFASRHIVGDDGIEDDPHPQYLRLDGGEISGDLSFSDSASIDGMHFKYHTHTGEDGTHKINGADILNASLIPMSVNSEELIHSPINVSIIEQQSVSGVSERVNAKLEWEIDNPFLMYEVDIVPLED